MLSKYKPNNNLTTTLKKQAGRNNTGKITVAHKGGGHKKLYRQVDFQRFHNHKFIVNSINYDPIRSTFLAYLSYKDKKKHTYILAPKGLQNLDEIIVANKRTPLINVGDCYPIGTLPTGTIVHNIELYPGQGGQLIRSAGNYAKILNLSKNKKYMSIELASGEQRFIRSTCKATVGSLSNQSHYNRNLKKAGRSRWLGNRPTVRGVAMNPVDHPHGGGEGKTSGGRPSVTPWAKPTKGQPTRSKNKNNKFILIKRKK